MEKSTKSTLTSVAVFVVTFAVAFFVARYFFSGNSVDTEIEKMAETLNKNCPVQIDPDTRLDQIEALGNKTVGYHYTLVNIAKEDTTVNFTEAKAFVMQRSQQNIDEGPLMKDFREKDITQKYMYKDKNGQPVFDFIIKPTNK